MRYYETESTTGRDQTCLYNLQFWPKIREAYTVFFGNLWVKHDGIIRLFYALSSKVGIIEANPLDIEVILLNKNDNSFN